MIPRRLTLVASFLLLLAFNAQAHAEVDQSLSPYFFVEGQAGVESIALEASSADIKIAGVIADVVVTQTYKNNGQVPISARYVFPASTRAAVYGMKMTIGKRTINAKIKKRAEARQDYEAAKREGKSASLLEQDRPNVFSMHVANILPGDNIKVELRYTELVVPTDGVYEMVYPTVVGPRYVSEGADPADNQHAHTAYTGQGVASEYQVGISARISAGMPVFGIESPSHAISTQVGKAHVTTIAIADTDIGNRDFILRYRLASTEIASGLMLYEGAKENFFLMMVQPPQRPKVEAIPARDYVFVVDVSGSMHGYPLDVTGELMRELFAKMRPADRFNVVLFSGDSALLAEKSLPASQDNIDKAVAFVTSSPGAGGTELLPALQRAMALPADENASRSFVVVTDGYISAERSTFDFVRANLGKANVFTFGIGSSVNRYLIEGLAKAGLGVPFVATSESEARTVAGEFRKYIESPVLTNIKVSYNGFSAYEQQPSAVPDLFANRPVLVFGKWKGAKTGTIEVTGVSGSGRFVNTFEVGSAIPDASSSALRYLWARSRIADLADLGTPSAREEAEITQLGLDYSLLTEFTSFIAIHNLVRNPDGAAPEIDVALPMPEGVSDNAIGVSVGAEPDLRYLLAGLLMLAFVLAAGRRMRMR